MKYQYIKLIFALTITLAVSQISAQTYFDKPRNDTAEARFWATQMKDPQVVIGVFEDPFPEQGIRYLQSGIIPQVEEKYVEIMIANNLLKLWRNDLVKGTADSIIFVQGPAPSIDEIRLLQFESYAGSSWILCLKPCYDAAREKSGWLKDVNTKGNKFLTPLTAFEVVDYYRGSLLIRRNPSSPYGGGMKLGNAMQAGEMAAVYNYFKQNTFAKTAPDFAEKSTRLMAIPNDPFVKLIAKALIE